MKNSWNHFAIVLYLGGIILLCLFAAGRQKEEQEYAWQRPAAAVETPVSTPVVSWQEETVYGAVHMPKPDIAHRYVLDGSPVEPAAGADGMLKTREIAESRYYNAPSGNMTVFFMKRTVYMTATFTGPEPLGTLTPVLNIYSATTAVRARLHHSYRNSIFLRAVNLVRP